MSKFTKTEKATILGVLTAFSDNLKESKKKADRTYSSKVDSLAWKVYLNL